ncbi:hypothetical protein [Moheibacter stercoris]|uniref:Lipoprotein n=1 Tax=Moheibacter stercoris TaxID=1628251 RepID=A0ABV2LUX5_9FLAO
MSRFLVLIFCGILILGCTSKSEVEVPKEDKSLITNENLKMEFDLLIGVYLKKYPNSNEIRLNILVTKNQVYASFFESMKDCPKFPEVKYFYSWEKIKDYYVYVEIDGRSKSPERFFDMELFQKYVETEPILNLCHPYGFWSRYQMNEKGEIVSKKNTEIIEGRPAEDLFVEEDDEFRMEIIEEELSEW